MDLYVSENFSQLFIYFYIAFRIIYFLYNYFQSTSTTPRCFILELLTREFFSYFKMGFYICKILVNFSYVLYSKEYFRFHDICQFAKFGSCKQNSPTTLWGLQARVTQPRQVYILAYLANFISYFKDSLLYFGEIFGKPFYIFLFDLMDKLFLYICFKFGSLKGYRGCIL